MVPVSVADYENVTGNSTFFGYNLSTLPANAVLALITYVGDDQLEGIVNGDDYGPIDLAVYDYNHHLPMPVSSWVNGDVTLEARVNGDAYGPIDLAVYDYNHHIPYAPADVNLYPSGMAGAGGIKPVPEPSVLLLGFMALSCFIGLRKLWN